MALNDIELDRFKDPAYSDIYVGSWLAFDKADPRPEHVTDYQGWFVPQIPRLLIRRYTQPGDWVLDPMCGVGTTAVECAYLGRRSANVDLHAGVLDRADKAAWAARNANRPGLQPKTFESEAKRQEWQRFTYGDALLTLDLGALLPERASLVIWHPPYHDIIRFSDKEGDFSNCASVEAYLAKIALLTEKLTAVLAPGGHLALVIGDYYRGGEWVCLGHRCAEIIRTDSILTLKGVCVKRTVETTAKRGQKSLWRYRHLKNGSVEFQHEYIFLFRKDR